MNREELLENLNKHNIPITIIKDYLLDKEISEEKAEGFMNLIDKDITLYMHLHKMINEVTKYFIYKFEINSISKDNKVIYYF